MSIMFFEYTDSNNPQVRGFLGQWALVNINANQLTAEFQNGLVLKTTPIKEKIGDVETASLDVTTFNGTNYLFKAPTLIDFERGRPPVPEKWTA